MKYKVTANQDIHIAAYFHRELGEHDTLMWVTLRKNKPVDGVGEVLGVDPRCVPNTASAITHNLIYVPIKTGEDYLKDHFGLFSIEPSTLPD